MNDVFQILPQATEEQQSDGWSVECSFLRTVSDLVQESGEPASMEGVEATLMTAVDLLLRTYFPTGLQPKRTP